MRIAAHHIPGTSEHQLSSMLHSNPDYTPSCPWPEDCMVQWGNGIIPATPFFEAFPTGTFIRGEGASIAEAERAAFVQYERDQSCDHHWGRHRPGRGTYNNGAAFCRKCGGYRSRMFRQVVVLGHWRKPIGKGEHKYLVDAETDHEMNGHMDRKYPQDRASRKAYARLLRLRFNLFGVDETRYFS